LFWQRTWPGFQGSWPTASRDAEGAVRSFLCRPLTRGQGASGHAGLRSILVFMFAGGGRRELTRLPCDVQARGRVKAAARGSGAGRFWTATPTSATPPTEPAETSRNQHSQHSQHGGLLAAVRLARRAETARPTTPPARRWARCQKSAPKGAPLRRIGRAQTAETVAASKPALLGGTEAVDQPQPERSQRCRQ
jgi:hypothetical protein